MEDGVRLRLVACWLRVNDGPRLQQIWVGRYQLEDAEPPAAKTRRDRALFGILIGQELG